MCVFRFKSPPGYKANTHTHINITVSVLRLPAQEQMLSLIIIINKASIIMICKAMAVERKETFMSTLSQMQKYENKGSNMGLVVTTVTAVKISLGLYSKVISFTTMSVLTVCYMLFKGL